MKLSKINIAYYSATFTTRKVVRMIGEQAQHVPVSECDLMESSDSDIIMAADEVLIVGVPVYAGRIPAGSVAGLSRLKGNDTPAVIVAVYGNRDYDDALLELKDTLEGNDFKVVAAGAFIAQHSIFPEVGAGRPDGNDEFLIKKFGKDCFDLLANTADVGILGDIAVKGNRPYKTPGSIPLKPKGNNRCNECGTCVKLCPEEAIPADKPRKTDKDKCISCGRCIVVCPQHARAFGGIMYKVAGQKFTGAYSARKEPETIIA